MRQVPLPTTPDFYGKRVPSIVARRPVYDYFHDVREPLPLTLEDPVGPEHPQDMNNYFHYEMYHYRCHVNNYFLYDHYENVYFLYIVPNPNRSETHASKLRFRSGVVRIRSTTSVCILHGLVLLPIGISGF
ncbi:hypothetical protein VPH35_129326 [Triticum aestivum]